MKVALLSTCAVPVPPPAYGGVERFVATLAGGLVARGHEVLVYATADSRPAGRLRHRFVAPIWPPNVAAEREHARFAWSDLSGFGPDIVHVNGHEALTCGARANVPVVATIHDAPWPALVQIHADAGAHCVAISQQQARSLAGIARLTIIPHGLDVESYPAGRGDGGYVAFLGRIGPEKAPHLAIDAAREAGVALRIGGPYWRGVARYEHYFEDEFAPRLAQARGTVDWLGELDTQAKRALLGNAQSLLFPLAWEEPFGLVMIEAMLVGTPVVAFARGSVQEIVDEGITGFVVRDAVQMAAAVAAAARLDRQRCRARARERFDARAMVSRYEALYRALQKSNSRATASPVLTPS